MSQASGEALLAWLEVASSPSDLTLAELVTQDACQFAARGSTSLRVKRHAWLALERVVAAARAAGHAKAPTRGPDGTEVIELETPFGVVFLTPSDVIKAPPKAGLS